MIVDEKLYCAFVLATAVLMLIPGPNVALIVSNSISGGLRRGLATVSGTTVAMIPQLAITLAGMTAVLSVLSDVFSWFRWVGVVYLAYLGIRQWRDVDRTEQRRPADSTTRSAFTRGLFVSLTNPKTLLFYGAFFPQFVVAGHDPVAQLIALACTFLTVAALVDTGWALLGTRLAALLRTRRRLRNRVSGGFLVGAAVGLSLARQE